jgi:hypothetical protein
MLSVTPKHFREIRVTTGRSKNTDQGENMPTAAPPPVDEPRVNFGGRVRESVRKRARVYAVQNDVELQDLLDQAVDEYLRARGA